MIRVSAGRVLALCWALMTTPALAEAPCDIVSFPATSAEAIHTAQVMPGPHANFLSGRGTCPDETASCREPAYVVPGDVLLTGSTHGSYSCAYYTDGKKETAGWLLTARLHQQPDAALPRSAWLGTWRDGDSTLAIKRAGSDLAISAHAYWPSRSDPDGHEGHLDAQGVPKGKSLALADPDDPEGCKLTLSLQHDFLVAHDNGACGGANVTLSGVYLR